MTVFSGWMKRSRCILVGAVVFGVFCWLISSGPAPMPVLSMRSLGPAGSLWTRTNAMGQIETGPRWSFEITNSSPTSASWWASLDFTDTNMPSGGSTVGMDGKLVHGGLRAYKQAVITMAVPSDTNTTWRGTIYYCKGPTQLELAVWRVVEQVPWLRNRFGFR